MNIKFITVGSIRINTTYIKMYYKEASDIIIELIDGSSYRYKDITIEDFDKLLGVNKPKPRPRG